MKLIHDLKIALLIAFLAAILAVGNYCVRRFILGEKPLSVQVADFEMNAPGGFISGDELHSLIKAQEEILILDVRSDLHFALGHIPGALNFTRSEFDKDYPVFVEKIRNAPRVVLYCADPSCDSSKVVAARLRSLGHKHISVYSGGWEEWKRHFDKQYFPNP